MVATYSLYPQGLVMWVNFGIINFLKLFEMKKLKEDNLCSINGGLWSCFFSVHIYLATRSVLTARQGGEAFLNYCWNN